MEGRDDGAASEEAAGAESRSRRGRTGLPVVAVIGSLLASLALVLHGPPGAHADARRGERVFQRCYACHSVIPGEDKLPGPNLACVLGRRAGSRSGFEFTEAMLGAGTTRGLVWSRETLDAFLTDPQAIVPGTTMGLPGLPAAEDRRDVIDYLAASGAAGDRGCPT